MTAVPDLSRILCSPLAHRAARVVTVERIAGKLLRVVLADPSLSTLGLQPGQHFSTCFRTNFILTSRRYSVRRFDPAAGTLEFLVYLHGSSPGGRWAAGLLPGDTVHLWGPGGDVVARHQPSFQLFVGDETALGAFSGIVSRLPASADVLGVIAIDSGAEALVRAAGLTFIAVPRCTQGDPNRRLLTLLARWILPSHDGAAYLAGGAAMVRAVEQLLVDRHRWPRGRIASKAFWSEGRAGL